MDERDPTSHPASDWLPAPRLDEHERPPSEPGRPTEEPSGRTRRRGVGPALGIVVAITAGLAVGLLAVGETGGGGDEAAAERDDIVIGPGPGTAATAAQRRLIHRSTTQPGVVRIGDLSASEAALLADAAQIRDERANARRPDRGELEAEGTLSLYPVDNQDRYAYLRRAAAAGTLLVEIGHGAHRFPARETLARVTTALRMRLGQLVAVAGGLDRSLYRRSRRLHGILTRTASGVEGLVDSGRTAEIRPLGSEFVDLGRSIRRQLRRAAAAARSGDQQRAGRLLREVDRHVGAIEGVV